MMPTTVSAISTTPPPRTERVTFASAGETLVGVLHLPAGDAEARHPAVVILGPMTFAKEQAPHEYARRFAERGFAALAFDPRFRGESTGQPRCLEDPHSKVADVGAAVAYLATRSDVDAERIAGMAVCQGSSSMLRAAADTPGIRALVTVAGHYRDAEGDVQWMGSPEALAERRARGDAALAAYRATGEVEYVPAVDPERTDVGMPGSFVWQWYHGWAERGVWENRYALMSDAGLLAFESISAARRLGTPYLMIHSDASFLPDAARRHFAAVPGSAKELAWEGDTAHFQYYDDPAVLDRTATRVSDWFRRHLGLGTDMRRSGRAS